MKKNTGDRTIELRIPGCFFSIRANPLSRFEMNKMEVKQKRSRMGYRVPPLGPNIPGFMRCETRADREVFVA